MLTIQMIEGMILAPKIWLAMRPCLDYSNVHNRSEKEPSMCTCSREHCRTTRAYIRQKRVPANREWQVAWRLQLHHQMKQCQ